MTKELYVSSTPHETKIALVEDDQLAEIFFERENEYTLAGSIYKGRVTRVLPGMQSAFVDVGLERDAFLYVSDFLELPEDEESEFEEIAVSRPEAFVSNRPAPEPSRFVPPAEPGETAAVAEPEFEEAEAEEATEGNTQEFAETDLAPGEGREGEAEERLRGNRRRRRGRRGRGFPENKFARPRPGDEAEAAPSEPEEYGAPAGYEPMILPGESLSKYRRAENAAPTLPRAAEPAADSAASGSRRPTFAAEGDAGVESKAETEEPTPSQEEPARERPTERQQPGERLTAGPTAAQRTPAPLLLPGESIAKYQPREPGEAGVSPAESPRGESGASYRGDRRPRREDRSERQPRPERAVQDYLPEGSGLATLPGESISKYRQRPAGKPQKPSEAAPAPETSELTEPSKLPKLPKLNDPRKAAAEEERHSQQAATFVIESEPWAETLAEEADEWEKPNRSAAHTQAPPVARLERERPPAETSSEPTALAEAEEPARRAKAKEPADEKGKWKAAKQGLAAESEASDSGRNEARNASASEPVTTVPTTAGAGETERGEPTESQKESRKAGSGEEQRLERMNLAATFGGEATEPPPTAGRDEEQSSSSDAPVEAAEPASPGRHEEHWQESSAAGELPESLEPAAPSAPAVDEFAGGTAGEQVREQYRFGHAGSGDTLEHEEIEGEEEESGVRPPNEDDDQDDDYIELVEETLDSGGRREAAEPEAGEPGEEFGEAVQEASEERAAMSSSYETRESGEVDDETVFEEEEIYGEEEEALPEEQQEEAIGRAEVRVPAATAGYPRNADRNSDRRDRDRNRGRRPPQRGRLVRRREPPRQQVMISDLLKEGQEILVQIAKEPIGKKGARITSHIALPGRFLVYMPTVNHVGVSRKITSDEERQRLKRIMISEREGGHGGFIVRTAAAGVGEDELRADIRFLKNLWAQIKQRAESSKAPALIYHDLNLVERILRDQVTSDFAQIWVDTEGEYERILNFANRFQPSLMRRVKLYTKEAPLFDQFGVTEEIDKALKAKVWLKSGGYIVINQTEALVAIDINTGKYVGKTARLEDTIVKTNVDAIKEIVRQIRLRDLGGIIVIDFIDMDERRNRQKVMQALEEALQADRAPSKVLAFNDFGLVAITRKRVKQSLERTLGSPCPYCTGNGFVKSVSTICNEMYVELRKMARHFDSDMVNLRVNPEIAKALKSDKGKWLQDFEEVTGRTVLVRADPLLHQEQFDING